VCTIASLIINPFFHGIKCVLGKELDLNTSDDNFEQDVLKADGPVLVDFWAEWCGPCKMIAPILEEIASEYGGKIKICKMDVDANTNTAPKFGIRGIPTLIIFNNGEVAGTKVGALSKSQLSAFIDSVI
jgi:thioredoxin 1